MILYSDLNYAGIAEVLSDDDSCLNDNPVGNDTLSSLRVSPGHEVTLYEHCDYQGRTETLAGNDPDLRDNPIGNESVSAVRVSCVGHSLPAGISFDLRLYIKLVRGYAGGYIMGLGFEQQGQAYWYPVTARENTLYLKLERDGRVYRGYYSPGGFVWHPVGPPLTADWTNPQAGLIAFAGSSTSQYEANFDWWHMVDLDLMPEIETVRANMIVSGISGTPPLTVQFTNESAGDYVDSVWDFGDGTTETLKHPAHTYRAVGEYTVTLTVSGPGGIDTTAKVITVQKGDSTLFLPLVVCK